MRIRSFYVVTALTVVAGCFGSNRDDEGGGDGGVSAEGSAGNRSSGGSSGPTGGPRCLFSSIEAEIAVTSIDKVDLLFVVDNSGSMREEQTALRAQFPRLIQVLTSGDRDGDGTGDFPPAKDLHLGVVSSDMGLVGVQGIPGCAGLGDDGILNNAPGATVAGCQATYPRFLSYTAGIHDPAQTATDFACLADLGTDGCGFEQQLESGLKALWPETYRDPLTGQVGNNPILFLGDVNGFGAVGHGDTDNAGFLRNDPVQGISLIAVVIVSDEEDCSSNDTSHFTPSIYLQEGDPLRDQDLNLRCFYNPENLYVLDRYVNGFRALRPGNEQLVVFGAIVGVPVDLVSEDTLAAVSWSDEASRSAFYASVLADPRMQEVPDPNRTPEQGGNLSPSCITDTGRAYPPRRIVQVAERFGENGIVQSICQEDFGPAIDAIIDRITPQLGAVCLPRKLVRNSEGLVGCNMAWELPAPSQAPANTPVTCGERSFLQAPDDGSATVSARGGQVCRVAQLAVMGGNHQVTDGIADGWYYDDFSEEVAQECAADSRQRIAFTADAQPPTGVTVKLQCANATTTVPNNMLALSGIDQPRVGDSCDQVVLNGSPRTGDEACAVRLGAPNDQWPDGIDHSMFCHPEDNVCVLACNTDVDCPPEWLCDDSEQTRLRTAGPGRDNGSPICVNQCASADGVGTSAADVGAPCLPDAIPASGFDDREAYIESSSEGCGGGACLVFRLRGDPREGCVSSAPGPGCAPSDPGCVPSVRCADPQEIRDRVYCSCRCDGPAEGGDYCACPDGFSCLAAAEQGPPGIAGSYCVKNGTFAR